MQKYYDIFNKISNNLKNKAINDQSTIDSVIEEFE